MAASLVQIGAAREVVDSEMFTGPAKGTGTSKGTMYTLVLGVLSFVLGLVVGLAGTALWAANDVRPIATGLIAVGVVLLGVGGLEASGWRRDRRS